MDSNRKANFGCGPDVKDGWWNFDIKLQDKGIGNDRFYIWDMTKPHFEQLEHDFTESFDYGLLNCMLCTVNDWSAHQVLINIHRMLKPGAKLTVIDMDLLKVFKSYQEGRIDDIPILEGDLDDRLCFAVSGYGTRPSIYTPKRMCKVLTEAGFRIVEIKESSEYDTRPKESLVVEATK